MVAPGWSLNHAKLRTMEDERDVLLVQERLLSDLKATMAPLERLAQEGRGTEGLLGELRFVLLLPESHFVNPSPVLRKSVWESIVGIIFFMNPSQGYGTHFLNSSQAYGNHFYEFVASLRR